MSLYNMQYCGFSSNQKIKRIYIQKVKLEIPAKDNFSDTLPFSKPWDSKSKPIKVVMKKSNRRAKVDQLAVPRHDYINFKKMSGNEILLNLDNYENLSHSELVSGLYELGKRDPGNEHDWNFHPITYKCIKSFKERAHLFNYRHIATMPLALQSLHITDSEAWQKASKHFIRMLHKYKAHDMA